MNEISWEYSSDNMIRIAERCFFSDKDIQLRSLEWLGISGEKNTTVLSIRGYGGEPEIQKGYKNIVTESGKYFVIAS